LHQASIPNFLKFPESDDSDTKNALNRLNEVAVRDGWRCALETIFAAEPARILYATDPARHKFVEVLPLTKESTILEIGSSHGQITTALAERAGFVHGLEVVPGQAEFAAERCRQEGLDNVAITCGGDDCELPYDNGLFDGVVINLVLEWCGARDSATEYIECQRRLLRECNRVLKPGGWFYLTTKNRYGWNYLLGKPDEHTFGWPFGQALPRWLLGALLKWRGKPRTVGLIHSYPAMQRLLSEAGFGELEPYWCVPEYRFPRELIPADASSIRSARKDPNLVQGQSRSTKLLMALTPAPLVKNVMPGLTFLAKKTSQVVHHVPDVRT
jgi:SAM-dependent methyltransferase